MDPEFLTSIGFWRDHTLFAQGFPGDPAALPELGGHVLFETSGSSGTPKWIALSKSALLASAAAVNRHLGVRSDSCWGLALPTRHVGGFGVAARAHAAGCRFSAFSGRWDPQAFTAWLAEHRVTHTSLVPTQVHDLVVAGCRAPDRLRAIVVGGGRLESAAGQTARHMGWPVLASYGMTEAASQIATQAMDALLTIYQPAPIPLLPIWTAEISSESRLRISGPALFSGTLVRRDAESWIFEPRTSDWYETQDRAELDGCYLTPLGRADTLVKVMGELVDPEAIERELAVLSDGALVPGSFAIIAAADERAGHVLVPVFDSAADAAIVETILSIYQKSAPGYRRLQAPVTLPGFPKSPLGKPRRSEISAMLVSRAAANMVVDPASAMP